MQTKHFLASKINITAILLAVVSASEMADKLPPALAKYAPALTFAGAIALFVFRTFFTSKTLTSDGRALTYSAPGEEAGQ